MHPHSFSGSIFKMSDKKPRDPVQRLTSGLRDLHERHRDRHRPTGFGFAFADRIDYFDPKKWDAVTNGQSVFLRREVLRVIESHGPANIEARYAMVFQQDRPVCCLAAQIVTVSGERLGKSVQKPSRHFSNFFRRAVRERILVAGNLVSWGFHGIAFAPGIDPAPLWPTVAE